MSAPSLREAAEKLAEEVGRFIDGNHAGAEDRLRETLRVYRISASDSRAAATREEIVEAIKGAPVTGVCVQVTRPLNVGDLLAPAQLAAIADAVLAKVGGGADYEAAAHLTRARARRREK